MSEQDWKIIQQCLQGDTRAFEKLVDKYQKAIFNVVYRMLNDYQEAEDVTQTVFINVYENLKSYKPKHKFFSWIYRMAVNETLNVIQRRKHTDELKPDMLSSDSSPERRYHQTELSEGIQQALMQLKPDYRQVIILRHMHGLSYREMSDILRIPEKTVKSRLFSARHLLKEILLRQGLGPTR